MTATTNAAVFSRHAMPYVEVYGSLLAPLPVAGCSSDGPDPSGERTLPVHELAPSRARTAIAMKPAARAMSRTWAVGQQGGK